MGGVTFGRRRRKLELDEVMVRHRVGAPSGERFATGLRVCGQGRISFDRTLRVGDEGGVQGMGFCGGVHIHPLCIFGYHEYFSGYETTPIVPKWSASAAFSPVRDRSLYP